MTGRIATRFARLAAAGRRAIVPFFTAGHPTRESTVPVMHALARAGADVIELILRVLMARMSRPGDLLETLANNDIGLG